MTLSDLTEQIQKRCYASVPLNLSRADFQQAIDQFITFLALPSEIKESIYFRVNPEDRGTEVGYKKYRRELGNTDNREYFHYNERADERFEEALSVHPELRDLLAAAKHIYQEAKQTIGNVLLSFEESFPGIHGQFFPQDQKPNFYLRLLKYDRMNPGDFLAKGHYDRGGCTLALAESAPGLRMGLNDASLEDVVHAEGQALFMPGLKFHEIASATYPPTWHDVVQKDEDTYNADIARWAVVFFADPVEMKKITYEEAHTPIY